MTTFSFIHHQRISRSITAGAAALWLLTLLVWPRVSRGQDEAVPVPLPTPVTVDTVPTPLPTDGDALPTAEGSPRPLVPELMPSGGPTPDPNLGLPTNTLSPAQNPQDEFNPPAISVIGPNGGPQPPTSTVPTQKPGNGNPSENRLLVDPLAITAMEQATGNAEMLFTGLGGMPRPLTSPYLSDLTPAGGFRRGDFGLNASVSLGFNFLTSSGDQSGSSATQFYSTISPELDVTLGEPATGRILSLQYFGSLSLGNTGDRQSPYDQTFTARGILTLAKLTLGVGLSVSEFSGGDRDFGGRQVGRQIVGLSLTGTYQFTEKTGIESDLTVPVRIFSQGDSSEGVTSTNFFNYNYSPLTTLSVGFAVGSLSVDHNRTQVFEQLLTRVMYNNGGPLIINGTLGVEFRNAGSTEEINPIVGLGATWQFRLGTSLALTAERRVFNSAADSGDNYVSSNVALTATQRLGDFVDATASIGYENASYDGTGSRGSASSNREDNYVIVQGGVVAKFGRRWSASALATYGNNQSNGNAVNFFHTIVQITFAY